MPTAMPRAKRVSEADMMAVDGESPASSMPVAASDESQPPPAKKSKKARKAADRASEPQAYENGVIVRELRPKRLPQFAALKPPARARSLRR